MKINLLNDTNSSVWSLYCCPAALSYSIFSLTTQGPRTPVIFYRPNSLYHQKKFSFYAMIFLASQSDTFSATVKFQCFRIKSHTRLNIRKLQKYSIWFIWDISLVLCTEPVRKSGNVLNSSYGRCLACRTSWLSCCLVMFSSWMQVLLK
jgi:hypothetical protein